MTLVLTDPGLLQRDARIGGQWQGGPSRFAVADPASGALLAVDFHRKDENPADDLMLDLTTLPRLAA